MTAVLSVFSSPPEGMQELANCGSVGQGRAHFLFRSRTQQTIVGAAAACSSIPPLDKRSKRPHPVSLTACVSDSWQSLWSGSDPIAPGRQPITHFRARNHFGLANNRPTENCYVSQLPLWTREVPLTWNANRSDFPYLQSWPPKLYSAPKKKINSSHEKPHLVDAITLYALFKENGHGRAGEAEPVAQMAQPTGSALLQRCFLNSSTSGLPKPHPRLDDYSKSNIDPSLDQLSLDIGLLILAQNLRTFSQPCHPFRNEFINSRAGPSS